MLELLTKNVPNNLKASALTIGKFDGLHKGHQLLINRICEKAKEHNAKFHRDEPKWHTVVFSFAIDKERLRLSKDGGLLTTAEERDYLLKDKIDYLVEYPVSKELFQLSPEDFVKSILVDKYNVKFLTVGEGFRFGHNREGNTDTLIELGGKLGFQVEVIGKLNYNNEPISSSTIRKALLSGNLAKVTGMLGHPYFILGEVVHGNHIGTGLGIPTINLCMPFYKLMPIKGVYVSRTTILDNIFDNGEANISTSNIGNKPTIGDYEMGVETYIIDKKIDCYGKIANVEFIEYMRPELKFNSLQELKDTMFEDVKYVRDNYMK